jgi:hypothetical protein
VLRDDIDAVEGYLVTRALIPRMIVYAVMACATCWHRRAHHGGDAAGASPSQRARGLVTRYTPLSTAKRGRTAEGSPRLLQRYW